MLAASAIDRKRRTTKGSAAPPAGEAQSVTALKQRIDAVRVKFSRQAKGPFRLPPKFRRTARPSLRAKADGAARLRRKLRIDPFARTETSRGRMSIQVSLAQVAEVQMAQARPPGPCCR